MLIEVKVPVFSESITEGTLLQWHKKPGEFVRRDEPLVDIETDKVVLEITAPKDGVLQEIIKGDGVVVTSEELIATINDEAKPAQTSSPAAEAPAPVMETTAPGDKIPQILLSPAAKKLVAEKNIDPSRVAGTGRDNRITKADIIHYLESHGGGKQMETSLVPPQVGIPTVEPGGRLEKRVPMSRLRQRVAERLKDAQNTAAILTTFNEVNMQPIMSLRNKYKEQFEKRHGARLGFMSFFVKAVTEALKQFPVVNASVDSNDIVYHGYFDIGIAVGSPRGLVVPVLRDVDQMSFADIEKGIRDFGQRAKDGKLALEELTGGTFSITNGGTFGSMLSTPILNPPQSAILGMHNITERAVVEGGEIVIRPMMYVALSYDHRIIDGSDAVLFLVAVKNALEDPARLLLEI
ncbi:MAG TPA: 2-oxoglutarate dehydrogenase complex dihydrolipoyllysine-residue succinyltransferase [Gammaproteobacteria bacterium]|nr:2-oxoglutarate dehydrogenase complex dihydrolipoyllysine-residue succinyltransferase [Gammaproteobacteria bacterium]